MPRKTPTRANHRADDASTARTVAHAPRVIVRVSSASGLLNRNMSTATGVRARIAPASSAAPCPKWRRTVAWRTATVATPMSTSGRRIATELSPKIRTDNAIAHSDAGGLSTVIALAASELPKKKADHDCEPAWAAAE